MMETLKEESRTEGKIMNEYFGIEERSFKEQEVRAIIKTLKLCKAAGPGQATVEMYKILDDTNIESIIQLIDEMGRQRNLTG